LLGCTRAWATQLGGRISRCCSPCTSKASAQLLAARRPPGRRARCRPSLRSSSSRRFCRRCAHFAEVPSRASRSAGSRAKSRARHLRRRSTRAVAAQRPARRPAGQGRRRSWRGSRAAVSRQLFALLWRPWPANHQANGSQDPLEAGQPAGPEGHTSGAPRVSRRPGGPGLAGIGGHGSPSAALPAVRTQQGGMGPSSRSPPAPVPPAAGPPPRRRRLRKRPRPDRESCPSRPTKQRLGWSSELQGCDGRSRAVGWGRRWRSSQARRRQRSPTAQQSVVTTPALQGTKASPRLGRPVGLPPGRTLVVPQGPGAAATKLMFARQFDGFPTPGPGARTDSSFGTMAGAANPRASDITNRAPAAGGGRLPPGELEHSAPRRPSRVGRW